MLVDGSTNDFLAGFSRGLGEILRVEHRVDLLLVASRAFVSHSSSSRLLVLLVLLSLHGHLLCLHIVVEGSWRATSEGHLQVRFRLARDLSLLLAMVHGMTLALHTPLLLMAIVVRSLSIAIDLMTNDAIERLSMHSYNALTIATSLSLGHRHRIHASLRLIIHLQLIHQKAKRRNQLDQVCIFGAHHMHLVLFVSLFVDLLFKVETSGLTRLYKSDIEGPTFEKNLRGGLLCSSSRLSISEAHERHRSISN